MRIIKLIFYFLIVAIGICFATLNFQDASLNFYFKTLSMPISLLVIIVLGLGIILGYLTSLKKFFHLKNKCRNLQKININKEKEIQNLRAIPIDDKH